MGVQHGAASQSSGTELLYYPEAARGASSLSIGWTLFAGLAAYFIVQVSTDSAGAALLAGTAALAIPLILRRRAAQKPRAKFNFDGRTLHLSGPAFAKARSIDLEHILDVYLDTKTIQRLREAPYPIPMLRVMNQTVGGEQDVARIAIELADETLFLTDNRVSHVDANEWFSRIRRFLRQHGWVPIDERIAAAGDAAQQAVEADGRASS